MLRRLAQQRGVCKTMHLATGTFYETGAAHGRKRRFRRRRGPILFRLARATARARDRGSSAGRGVRMSDERLAPVDYCNFTAHAASRRARTGDTSDERERQTTRRVVRPLLVENRTRERPEIRQ